MRKKLLLALFFLAATIVANAQTYTFECVCENVTGSRCDICNSVTQSRFFCGLLVKKNGTPHKWIDSPYIIKWNGTTAVITEIIPAAESISISMFGTPYTVLDSFKNAIICPCVATNIDVAVDTPIIGNGTPGDPITIGQFGADTTMFLKWNGHHWYPATIKLSDLNVNLPYYLGDAEAIANGLMPGDAYLLKCDNDYALPAGIFKVVKACAFDCNGLILYFPNDATAFANGIPVGRDYALSGTNIFGVLYGFIKSVASDTLSNDSLVCSTVLPFHINDVDALSSSLSFGDLYNMAQANTYGAPWGQHRALSAIGSTSADAPICCDDNSTIKYFINDTDAVAGGLSPGNYYYLAAANTYGYPYGSKKVIP